MSMDAKLKAMFEQLIADTIAGTHKSQAGIDNIRNLVKAKSQAIVAEMSASLDDEDELDPDLDDRGLEGEDDLDDLDDLDGELDGEDDLDGELDDSELDGELDDSELDGELDDSELDGELGDDEMVGKLSSRESRGGFDEPAPTPRRR